VLRGGDVSGSESVDYENFAAGANFTPQAGTLNFMPNETRKTISIPIVDDHVSSGYQILDIVLRNPTNGSLLIPSLGRLIAAATVTSHPIAQILANQVLEGRERHLSEAGESETFTVVLSSVPTADVTVPVTISNNGNPPGSVVTISPTTLTFTPSNALVPQTVTIPSVQDADASAADRQRTVYLLVGPAVSEDPEYDGLIDVGEVQVSTWDDETPFAGVIDFSLKNYVIDETAGMATITLERNGGSSGSTSVRVTTRDGSSLANGKHTPITGSISFAAGVTSRTFNIALADDGHRIDGDQKVILELSNPTNGALVGKSATLTIMDMDAVTSGDLDATFGTEGVTVFDLRTADQRIRAHASAILPLAGGYLLAGSFDVDNEACVWRTTSDGRPDDSFATRGRSCISFDSASLVTIHDAAIQPDNKIVVVGVADGDFAVARFLPDGMPDATFGNGGKVVAAFNAGLDVATSVLITDAGILVGGSAYPSSADFHSDFALALFGDDGSLDLGFGSGGRMMIPVSPDIDQINRMIFQPDGKLLLIGTAGGGGADFAAVRLKADFTLDATFGLGGKSLVDLEGNEFGNDAALLPDGKILVAGMASRATVVIRLNDNGMLDETFGPGGAASPDIRGYGVHTADALVVSPDGRITLVGQVGDVGFPGTFRVGVSRFLADGSPDRSFGSAGVALVDLWPDIDDRGLAAVLAPTGEVVVAGSSGNFPFLARVTAENPGGTIVFDQELTTVSETAGTATIMLNRTGNTSRAVAVTFFTSDRDPDDCFLDYCAAANLDYTPVATTVNFAAGETTKSVPVPILTDAAFEDDELVMLNMSSPTNGANIGSPSARLRITDVTPAPGNLSFSAASYAIDEPAGSVTITVRRNGGAAGTVGVSFTTADGSAVAGQDYTTANGSLTFGPGVVERTFVVSITNDAVFEGPQTLTVRLSAPTGGATLIGSTQATVTINDSEDEPRGVFQFASNTSAVTEGDTTVISVQRVGGAGGTVSVTYDIRASTGANAASNGHDFTAASGVLTFAVGETSKSFSVPTLNDADYEGPETVSLVLSSPTGGAGLGNPVIATLIIDDSDDDSSPPQVAEVQFVTAAKGISGVVLVFTEAIAGDAAVAPGNFRLVALGKDKRSGTTDDRAIAMAPPVHRLVTGSGGRQVSQVTLTPTKAIKLGKLTQVAVLGAATPGGPPPITDLAGNKLDGNADGTGGDNFVTIVARGTKISHVDSNLDTITYSLSGGGVIDLTLSANGDANRVDVRNAAAASVLTGTVKKPKFGGDGRTNLPIVTGLSAAQDRLNRCSPTVTTNCFQPMSPLAAVVDEILEANSLYSMAKRVS
jgi:uncharacterized delta-60 repeat protein